MKNRDFDLINAFPAMPAECRDALIHTARSVKEEPMKRKYPIAILIAAILVLMSTIAIAEGWNVLSFLGLQHDSDAQILVQPVSASASVGNCTIRIDSAITDGDFLAFDYIVENTHPDTPVYMVVEAFTANGEPIFTDGTDDFDCQWLPGWCNDGTMMNGEWVKLPELSGDKLHVEMVVGVYSPEKPVFCMDEFDPDLAAAKRTEGYYVIADGDGFIIDDPEEGLVHCFGRVNAATGAGLNRSEMKLTFDLDLKAARASVRTPKLPEPITVDGATLAVTTLSISPLQTHLIATFTPENASYEDIVRWSDGMNFAFFDPEGNELKSWDICLSLLGESPVEEASDGTWYRKLDYTLIEVNQSLPDEITLTYVTEDGFRIDLPIALK
ncbi:MAG: DUF4179 domain-containing protein [Aristaeellaceae bacterium]